VVGVIAFFALRTASEELVLAWANLASSVALVGALLIGIRMRLGPPPDPRLVASAVVSLIRSIPLPASFVVMYPLSLALAPRDRPGQVTLFGLAFTACSYLAGFTGQALSMAEAVQLGRLGPEELHERRRFVVRAFRYSMLLAAPGLGVAAVAGGPVVDALLPAGSRGANGDFGLDMLLLVPWLVATLGVWATLPAVLSGPRRPEGGRLAAAIVGLVAAHVVATVIGRVIWGFDGIVVAMAIAPAAFVAAAVSGVVPTAAGDLLRLAAVIVAVTGASFGVFELIGRALGRTGSVAGITSAALGVAVYVAVAAAVFPDATRTFKGLLARR
jgi:hypothetical protein